MSRGNLLVIRFYLVARLLRFARNDGELVIARRI